MPKSPQPDDLDSATSSTQVDLLLSDLGTAPEVPDASIRERGRVVLVVDSVSIARKFLMQRLETLGYEVHSAENGDRALAMVEHQAYAIVFLELTLEGGIDGLGLCQAIKQAPLRRDGVAPAVVFTTGDTGSSNRVRGWLAGCDAYLHKPLLEDDLIAALRDVDPLFR
jgi:two-component system cell cycle response regulator